MESKKKNKIEFSKQILIGAGALYLVIILFTCVMVWRTLDTSVLPVLVTTIAAEVATGTAFYYNKAKKENEIKLEKAYNKTINK